MHVLIAQNDSEALGLLRATLETAGFVVISAADGAEALELLETEAVEAVISDLPLPRLDGARLCLAVRKHERLHALPFILYTSDPAADAWLALGLGADLHLARPAPAESLVQALMDAVQAAQRHDRPAGPEEELGYLRHHNDWLLQQLKARQAATVKVEPRHAEDSHRELAELVTHSQRIGRMGSWKMDVRRGRLFWPETTCALFGITPSEFTGTFEHFESFILPEDMAAYGEAHARVSPHCPALECEYRIRRPDGSTRWMYERGTVEYDADGSPVSRVGMVMDVTEQQEARQRLSQSAALLRLAGQIARVGAWTFELPERTLVWSDENCAIHDAPPGYQPSLEEGIKLYPKEHRAEVMRRVEACARHGTPYDFELPKHTLAGRRIWVRSIGEAVRDADGSIVRVQGALQDITDRKAAQERLRQSEETLALAQSVAHLGSWEVDLDDTGSNTLRWSDETFRIFGFEPGAVEVSKSAFLALVHPADVDRVTTAYDRMIRTGARYSLDHRIVLAGGTERVVHEEARLIYDEDTRLPLKVAGTVQDITSRKAVEEVLREQAELLNLAHDAIMVRDMEDHISLWNRGAEVLYGWTATEAIGRCLFEILHLDDASAYHEATERVLATGQWTGEWHTTDKAGRQLTVEGRWTLLRDEHGQPKAVLAINTDITERRLHERLAFRSQRLESLGTLAGGIAHDLNNALAPIVMGVELLRTLYPQESKFMDIFEASARRGADMVKQLITFARGAEGERVATKVCRLIHETEALMRGSFPKNITLSIHCDPTLPAVLGDATQLHQILMNLCVNARDAMPNGGLLTLKAERVEVDAAYASAIPDAKPGSYVVLRVGDTGTGIPAAILDRIFDPFFTTKGPEQGTGLGLSTVMGITRGHGGFLQVTSRAGKGSNFAVHLPAHLSGTDVQPVVKHVPVEFHGSGETILLVDDEAAVREMACAVLRRLNYNPITATDGADGLAKAALHHVEIRAVITDMHMAFMDGLAFVRALRRMLPEVPVTVASGRMDEATTNEFKALGVHHRLDKPFSEARLAEALQQLLAPTLACV